MSDHSEVGGHVFSAVGKVAVTAGPTAYGLLTLNSLALIVGILSSLAILAHTLLKIWWGYQDRQRP